MVFLALTTALLECRLVVTTGVDAIAPVIVRVVHSLFWHALLVLQFMGHVLLL